MADAHSLISEIIAEVESAEERLHALAARSDPGNWMVRNRPESWSVAECVEHLNMTSRAFIPLIRTALANDPHAESAAPKTFKRDPAGFLLSGMVGPLRQLGRMRIGRVKTTPEFEPKDINPKEASVEDFNKLQTDTSIATFNRPKPSGSSVWRISCNHPAYVTCIHKRRFRALGKPRGEIRSSRPGGSRV